MAHDCIYIYIIFCYCCVAMDEEVHDSVKIEREFILQGSYFCKKYSSKNILYLFI